MKMKLFHWMLLGAMTCGLSLSFAACSDDDDDNKSEEQKQEEAEQANDQATLFWNVVGQLAGTEDYTDDYADKTFEPTIGTTDENSQYTRVVALNTMKAAAESFANLVDANIDENTPSYEFKNDGVGTLTYTRVNDGRTFATVDVNIKQLPHLQRIVYMNGEQLGENGSFNGAAYYRFGDVIKKDDKLWVCVRPAFGPENKQDSHWITVDRLDDKNIEPITKSNKHFWVPKGLGKNKEHMQNLAELLYAMLKPIEWRKNIEDDAHLDMFHDFNHAKLPYHNVRFWEQVLANWRTNDLFNKVFHVSEEQMLKLINGDGLNFLYSGYSWWSTLSWNLTLYQMNYKGTNMSMATETEKKVDMRNYDDNSLDVRNNYWEKWAQLAKFFGDPGEAQPRWIIRHATGADLCTGSKYNEKDKIGGCVDTYTYYHGKNVRDLNPEVTTSTGLVGDILCTNGFFYAHYNDAEFAKATPVGIVVYRGAEGTSDRVSWNPNACGLVMMLQDYEVKQDNKSVTEFTWCSDDLINQFIDDGYLYPHVDNADDVLDNHKVKGFDRMGIAQAINREEVAPRIGMYPLLDCIESLNNSELNMKEVLGHGHFSQWFAPTLGDFVLAFDSLARHPELAKPELKGTTYEQYRDRTPGTLYGFNSSFKNDVWETLFERAGIKALAPFGYYWLNTQSNIEERAWMAVFTGQGVSCLKHIKSQKARFRPFLSFAVTIPQ